jgi:hypothetical protein
LIKKYNEANKTVIVFFKNLRFSSNVEAINTLRRKAILEIKENVSSLLSCKEKYLPENEFRALMDICDTLVKKEMPQHTKLAASIARLDLMHLVNEYISRISFGCGKILLRCGWSPFYSVMRIKNYSEKEKSFVALTCPYGEWYGFKGLKRKESSYNDTLSIPKLITFRYNHDHSDRYIILNLEKLPPGKYSIDAVVRLELPGLGVDSNMYYNSKANKFQEYSESVDFEVFK